MPLKAVLIGPRGTVFQDGKAQTSLIADLVTFIRHMAARGVHVGLWSRHTTTYTHQGQPERVEDYLSRVSGVNVPLYLANSGTLPTRQKAGSVDPILKHLNVLRHETILVGNEESDMQAGVNNQLLLVRPEWYRANIDYGFAVNSFSNLTRLCELFGLRQHPIFWSVDSYNLRVRSMGPFSTRIPDFAIFGIDARNAAKYDAGQRQFWFWMIISSLYFSGLIHQVDYICPFPGHNPTVTSEVRKGLDAVMTILGKCFRKPYLPDLLIRHKSSIKSQTASVEQKTFGNQLNTLHLNRFPHRYDGPPNKGAVVLRNKGVLVVDDICTNGRSLDTARAYIEAAGGHAILFSWLKTISSAFMHMAPAPTLMPFEPNEISAEPPSQLFRYNEYIVNPHAPAEIDAALEAFKRWK